MKSIKHYYSVSEKCRWSILKNITNVRCKNTLWEVDTYFEGEKEKVSMVGDIIGKMVGGHKNTIKDGGSTAT